MSREPIYTLDCWHGFSQHIKTTLDRELTKKEYSLIMNAYITRRPIESLLEELK